MILLYTRNRVSFWNVGGRGHGCSKRSAKKGIFHDLRDTQTIKDRARMAIVRKDSATKLTASWDTGSCFKLHPGGDEHLTTMSS